MRIALIAPIVYPVPPGDYGGTERVVDLLARGLQHLGQDVEVFAASGSRPDLPLAADAPSPLPEHPAHAYAHAEAAHVRRALARAREFDIFHDHTKKHGLQLAGLTSVPMVSTMHNPVDPSRAVAYHRRPHHPWVAISRAQARSLRAERLCVAGVVPHGLEASLYHYSAQKRDYLLSLGRITADKGVHRSIALAEAARLRLIIAGPIADGAADYFRTEIEPHLDGDRIQWVGAVGGERKQQLLSEAAAFVFPIQWEEPFGLVLIEALACGTPVLATAHGAVPEIITDPRVGRVVATDAELLPALFDVLNCRPADCRRHVERHFSAERMARDYLAIYERLLVERHAVRAA